jgi:hypothetical protein
MSVKPERLVMGDVLRQGRIRRSYVYEPSAQYTKMLIIPDMHL